jgi:putative sigma-54 modulation protein
MEVILRSHHASPVDGLREHAERKLQRLERYLPRVDDVVIEVEHEDTRSAAHRYRVQVTARSAGAILRAEERRGDPRSALDAAAERLSEQARRHKARLDGRGRAVTRDHGVPPPPAGAEEADEYAPGEVVRVKRFEAKPMSRDEALAQMDLVGHDFFVFLDTATGEYAVLYKRRDGGFGLLVPERG